MPLKFHIIILVFGFTNSVLLAQTPGCTDQNANNYNALATQNDGSCTYDNLAISPLYSYELSDSLIETSGLIEWNNSLWTLNDNADNGLYAIDTNDGHIINRYPVNNIPNTDWEELTQDSLYVYVGDFGNNTDGIRTDLRILKVEKQSLLAQAPVIDTIWFSYANQTDFGTINHNNTDFDCEAFIVSRDSLYLFTKQWVSEKTSVYTLPKNPGTYVAHLRDSFDVNGLITGATFMEEERILLLCGYSSLLQPFMWAFYDYSGDSFFSGNKRKVSLALPFHQVEGIFTKNGRKLFISNEFFSYSGIVTNPQKLHEFSLEQVLDHYLLDLTKIQALNAVLEPILLYPNPTIHELHIKTPQKRLGNVYNITDILGKEVMSDTLTTENTVLDTDHWPHGVYWLKIGNTERYRFSVIRE